MPHANGQRELTRQRLVALIWLYLVLLIVEGALRKWLLPELSDPLLLVRDPVALAIGVLGYRNGYLVFDEFMRSLFLLCAGLVALGGLQLVNGVGGSPLVIAFGLRTYLLHVPVAFVTARALDANDIRRILVTVLCVSIPMALLMVVQFESPVNSFINAGARGHSGQIFAANGHIRPAGTFSFVTGPVAFFSIALAAVISSYVDLRGVSWPLRVAGWLAVATAAAVSGSRSFLAGAGAVLCAGAVGWFRARSVRHSRGLIAAALTALVAVNVLGSFDTVNEGTQVIQTRLDQLDNGGLSRRLMYDYYTIEWAVLDSPPLGVGLGAGTNAAAAFQGVTGFRWGEGEWPRVIFEAGPILGVLYILWRVWLTLATGRAAFRAAGSGALLPLLLWGACASTVASGQWGQATIQGFSVFGLGLCLAAGRCAVQRPAAQESPIRPPRWNVTPRPVTAVR